jgi:hypothetical protein
VVGGAIPLVACRCSVLTSIRSAARISGHSVDSFDAGARGWPEPSTPGWRGCWGCRTAAAALAEDGGGRGTTPERASGWLTAGGAGVRLPEAPAPVENTPSRSRHGDPALHDDIVAWPPPGVAARATVGWHADGAWRSAAAGRSMSWTHERWHQAPPRRWHIGRHGGGFPERAYTVLKRALASAP